MKKDARLVSLDIYCPNQKEVVSVDRENYQFDGYEGCLIKVGIQCACGQKHLIEVGCW